MSSVPSQATTATSATSARTTTTARSTPPGRRAVPAAAAPDGRTPTTGSASCSSASRAAPAPEAGTSTSRGPAARRSGTPTPPLRLVMLGMPSSNRTPWMSSASAWCAARATRTSSPSVYCGRILRARAWRSGRAASCSPPPAKASGIPQAAQKRSSPSAARPHPGQTSAASAIDDQLDLGDAAVLDPEVSDLGLVPGQADDEPLGPGPVRGEVRVRLRRVGVGARVRVVDRADVVAAVLDGGDRPQQDVRLDVEPERAGGNVLHLRHLGRGPVPGRHEAAALVGELAAGVVDDAVEHRPRDPHRRGGLLRLERGALVLVPVELAVAVAVAVAAQRVLELAHALADRAAGVGQLLRAEHDQRDREDEDELHGADVRHAVSPTTTRWCRAPRPRRPDACRSHWKGTSIRRRTR